MTMRTIAPLNDRDWKILVEDLEKGQTDGQAKFMREAIELADGFDVSDDG